VSPTPETPAFYMLDDATFRPFTPVTPPTPPMPIFCPVAAFIITLLFADGGRFPILVKWFSKQLSPITYWYEDLYLPPLKGFPTTGFLFIYIEKDNRWLKLNWADKFFLFGFTKYKSNIYIRNYNFIKN